MTAGAADAELMARYCEGDTEAFRELYKRAASPLFNYLLRMSGERSTAEDLLQLTFLNVHRARHAYVRGANPMPWLYAIAHRTFLDEVRKRKRAKVRVAKGDEVPEVAAHITGKAANDVRERPDPELTRAALAALDQLPPNQREALVLTKLHGKSIKEAAEITGSSPGAIKLRAHRAYVALRKLLGDAS